MPVASLINIACETVGSVSPFSQLDIVLSDTPQYSASCFCVMFAIFRATGKVTFVNTSFASFLKVRLNRNYILQQFFRRVNRLNRNIFLFLLTFLRFTHIMFIKEVIHSASR